MRHASILSLPDESRNDVVRRFWKHIVRPSDEDACWGWVGATFPFGYGCMHTKGTRMSAHRISYELHKGPIEGDLHVLHSCNNPACSNPRHLRLGTAKDNMLDRKLAGRHGLHLHPERAARGERSGNCKVKDDDVRKIHALCRSGMTQLEVARMMGISQTQVSKVILGKKRADIWREVNENLKA